MESTNVNAQLIAAGCVGIASWPVFRRSNIRGDYVLLFYLVTAGLLYTIVRLTSGPLVPPLVTPLTLGFVYAVSLLLTTAAYRLSPFHPLATFPGPVACKVTGLCLAYISFTGKRHTFFDRLHATYGPFVRVGPNIVSISSPAAVAVYENTTKSELYRIADRSIQRVGLFFKPDTKRNHRERRRIWHGFFTTAGLTEVLPSIERRTWQLVHALETQQEDEYVDVGTVMGQWAFDVMGDVVFGGMNDFEFLKKGDPNGIISSSKLATTIMDSVGITPWLLDILWYLPATRTMHASRDHAMSMMRTRMKAERALDYRDLASYWMEGGIPEDELMMDAVVAMAAGIGSDTTASNLTFCIYFLAAHPECALRLRQELDEAFPDPAGYLDPDVLQALPYLNGFINESLRLSTPYYMPRVVPEGGMVIDGRFIPEGTDVSIATNSQHMSEENFSPEPLEFRPARWIPGGLGPDTKTNKTVLGSFGFGEHACIGKPLAWQEMRHALARLVLVYDFAFPQDFDVAGFPRGMRNARATYFEVPLRVRAARRPGVAPFKDRYD